MQLVSADTTIFKKKIKIFFAHEKLKKPSSKVAHNSQLYFFSSTGLAALKTHFWQKKEFKGLTVSPFYILLGANAFSVKIDR